MEEEWKRLSEKEFQIMTYMWEENHPLTMNEIREKIGTQGKPANVSTTGSQIRGLIEKGFISQSGHRGQMARYMASVSKEAYYKWELHFPQLLQCSFIVTIALLSVFFCFCSLNLYRFFHWFFLSVFVVLYNPKDTC